MHSRHQTPPSWSHFAPESSCLPHPGSFGLFLFLFASFPPHTKHDECHRLPFGPGHVPISIGLTLLLHQGQYIDPPKRGNCPVVPARGRAAGAEGAGADGGTDVWREMAFSRAGAERIGGSLA